MDTHVRQSIEKKTLTLSSLFRKPNIPIDKIRKSKRKEFLDSTPGKRISQPGLSAIQEHKTKERETTSPLNEKVSNS